MREIETDYLVVGAGASGMAFVDALIAQSDAEVVMVDRRHRPGGHWLDAYPFVRLHQPSANYGVTSRVLGNDRIDTSGPNTGFYERATAAEICDYFNRVMEEHFLPSGQVRFFGMCDYRGGSSDEHHFVSNLSGDETTVRVRRKVVDATYIESSIPSKHTPMFEVDADVRVIPPNRLVERTEPSTGYTVLGAGKTAMDTCVWLLDEGVDPDRIRWIKPRDAWLMNRVFFQPLELVGAYMQLQAAWVRAAAEMEDGDGWAQRLEEHHVLVRVDPSVEPEVFRGATISMTELESLRRIENVVRKGKVMQIASDHITLRDDAIASDPGQLYVDCTAAGVRPVAARPVFEADRITMQYVTPGLASWSGATVGTVEALRDDDEEKNRLCPPAEPAGDVADIHRYLYASMSGLVARAAEPDLSAWNDECRLNPSRGASDRADDPRVQEAYGSIFSDIGPALSNLE
ncbi:MAG TPA: NAD(P)-binding protein [Acidimicrobiales bacterium]|nr:NAD(P)-binding protein [Acidimicrobiales bacterium]